MVGTVLAIKHIQSISEEEQMALFGHSLTFNIMPETIAPAGVVIANNSVKRAKQRNSAKQLAADKRVIIMFVIDVI